MAQQRFVVSMLQRVEWQRLLAPLGQGGLCVDQHAKHCVGGRLSRAKGEILPVEAQCLLVWAMQKDNNILAAKLLEH